MVHRDRRAHRESHRKLARAWQLVARALAVDGEAEERRVRNERVPALQGAPQHLRGSLAAGLEEDAHEADGPAERGVIRHRVRARARGKSKAEVEEAVPDDGGEVMVRKPHQLTVYEFT